MFGRKLWFALSNRTSPMPRSTVAAITIRYSPMSVPVPLPSPRPSNSSGPGRPPCRPNTTKATTRVTPARARFDMTISFARSTRSVMTPAGRLNSSQGSRWATTTREISSGFLVTAEANHG